MEKMLNPNRETPALMLVKESPLNYYYHEVDAPFHARSNSRALWDKIAKRKTQENLMKLAATQDSGNANVAEQTDTNNKSRPSEEKPH